MLKHTGPLVLDPAKTLRPENEELRCLCLLSASQERRSRLHCPGWETGKSVFKLIVKPQILLNSSVMLYISVMEILQLVNVGTSF